MALTLLHTAQVHVDTFNALRDRIAPGVSLDHLVYPELLAAAQKDGVTPELAAQIATLIGLLLYVAGTDHLTGPEEIAVSIVAQLVAARYDRLDVEGHLLAR